jgi:hypothetical protein
VRSRGLILVAQRGFPQATPLYISPSACWAVGVRSWVLAGSLHGSLCFGLYHLAGDKLRQVCLEQGLDSSGSVRLLRQRLVGHLRSGQLEVSGRADMAHASAMTDSEREVGVTIRW